MRDSKIEDTLAWFRRTAAEVDSGAKEKLAEWCVYELFTAAWGKRFDRRTVQAPDFRFSALVKSAFRGKLESQMVWWWLDAAARKASRNRYEAMLVWLRDGSEADLVAVPVGALPLDIVYTWRRWDWHRLTDLLKLPAETLFTRTPPPPIDLNALCAPDDEDSDGDSAPSGKACYHLRSRTTSAQNTSKGTDAMPTEKIHKSPVTRSAKKGSVESKDKEDRVAGAPIPHDCSGTATASGELPLDPTAPDEDQVTVHESPASPRSTKSLVVRMLDDIKIDPRYQLFEPPHPARRKKMKEDMKKAGIRTVLTIDQDDQLISGFTRYEICQELKTEGVNLEPVECLVVTYGSEDERIEDAVATNTLRRDLSGKLRAKVARLLLKQHTSLSDNQISGLCDVTRPTITKYRKELEQNREIAVVERTQGLDGRITKRRAGKSIPTDTENSANALGRGDGPQSTPDAGTDAAPCDAKADVVRTVTAKELARIRLVEGDAVAELKKLSETSVDLIVLQQANSANSIGEQYIKTAVSVGRKILKPGGLIAIVCDPPDLCRILRCIPAKTSDIDFLWVASLRTGPKERKVGGYAFTTLFAPVVVLGFNGKRCLPDADRLLSNASEDRQTGGIESVVNALAAKDGVVVDLLWSDKAPLRAATVACLGCSYISFHHAASLIEKADAELRSIAGGHSPPPQRRPVSNGGQ